jgi:Flp pilus assembly protein TadD
MRSSKARARQPAEMSAAVTGPGQRNDGAEEMLSGAEDRVTDEREEIAADDEAVHYWRDMVLRDPADVSARQRLARIYELRGEIHQVVEQLESARTVQPENVELVVDLANAQISLRRFDAAERELRRALKIHANDARVHLGLGVISFRRGLYAQAEQELRRSIELDGALADAYYYRGEALNQLSRVDEAIDMLLRATQLRRDNGRAYYMMGILYDKKGRPQEAAAMYRKAREVGGA